MVQVAESGPSFFSFTSRPTATMWRGSVGSMSIGATKSASVRPGSIDVQVVPPSTVTLMPPFGSSSYATLELSGSTSA